MQLQLTVFNNRIKDFINSSITVRLLDSSCAFAEGPVWCKEGFYFFSDIPRNTIYKIGEQLSKTLFLEESGCQLADKEMLSEQVGSNGLALNSSDQLIICQHGEGAVVALAETGIRPIVSTYMGKRFNSPNDLVLHADGSLFFSDPPYGLKDQQLSPHFAQPKAGIYCYRNDSISLFCDAFQYPNGVCLSPNQQSLYCCSNKSFERFVLEYDVSTLEMIRTVAVENGDGIKCDGSGNIYLCTKEGVLILDTNGIRLGLIVLPTIPANCCWGGPKGNDLLVAARENIFLIKNLLQA